MAGYRVVNVDGVIGKVISSVVVLWVSLKLVISVTVSESASVVVEGSVAVVLVLVSLIIEHTCDVEPSLKIKTP